MQLSVFFTAGLAGIDETRGKSAVEMVSKRQAKLLVCKSNLWKFRLTRAQPGAHFLPQKSWRANARPA
jgi:hypothetical protein